MKKYVCEKCGKEYKNKTVLKNHKTLKHPDQGKNNITKKDKKVIIVTSLIAALLVIISSTFFWNPMMMTYDTIFGNSPDLYASINIMTELTNNESLILRDNESVKNIFLVAEKDGLVPHGQFILFTTRDEVNNKNACTFFFPLITIESSGLHHQYPKTDINTENNCEGLMININILNLGSKLDYLRGRICFNKNFSILQTYGDHLTQLDDDCVILNLDKPFFPNEGFDGYMCISGKSSPKDFMERFMIKYEWYDKEFELIDSKKGVNQFINIENCQTVGQFSNIPGYITIQEFDFID